MKKLLIVGITAASMVAVAESLYIPASTVEHSGNYILKEGEVVYNVVDETYASLVVGNNTRRPFYVSDERALKCENIFHTLDETVLTIEKSDNVTYENGTYLIVNNKSATDPENEVIATFTITAPSGYILGNINYDTAFLDNSSRFGNMAAPKVTMSFKDNVAVMTVATVYATENKYWNFTAKIKNTSNNIVNDTLEDGKDFVIADKGYKTEGHGSASEGSTYRLSNLRSWVANLYNGDRGRHWANYDACNDVNMGERIIKWRDKGSALTGFRDDGDKLGFFCNGQRSMYLTQTVQGSAVSNDYSNADIKITSIDVNTYDSSNVCQIAFTYEDVPNAELDKWTVKYAPSLQDGGDWIFITPTIVSNEVITSSNGYVVVNVPKTTATGKTQGFWRIVYDSTMTTIGSGSGIGTYKVTPQVVLDRADLIVTSKIVLKSPAGKFFTVKVSDTGVLSTEEYKDEVNFIEK